MALPSSPPLLPDDIDLPSAPTLLPLASGSSAPIGSLSRKRQHSDYGSLSSDPLFSDTTEEDDSQEQDAIDQPRRKRQTRRPWWHVGQRKAKDLRRNMAKDSFRNADSGVWMGSDASEDSVDSIISSQQRMQELAMEDVAEEVEQKAEQLAPTDAEGYASRIIQMCLDSGKEAVDLSDLALNSISDATLRPLHQLIRQSFHEHTHPPSEDEFVPLTPSIKLILSNNQLSTLPTELFTLTNVSVLSLRSNHLDQLPSAISRLTKLKELNIAGNSITYLPWDLLDLLNCRGSHRQINVRPNPLVEPTDLSGPSPLPKWNHIHAVGNEELSRFADTRATIDLMRQKYAEGGYMNMRGELELRLKLGRMLRIQYLQEVSRSGRELQLCKEELIYLASSKIRYFSAGGIPERRSGVQTANSEDWSASLDPAADAPQPNGSAAVPSLFELALRQLQATHNLQEALPYIEESEMSSTVTSAIRQAAANSVALGNETCSNCQREFVVARAEWMEFWFYGFPAQAELNSEAVLPFLRRACSLACARPSEVGEFQA